MQYDAIIVGAGIGGAIFAQRFARASKSVLVLERSAAPPTLARPGVR